jgi:hypothetical protein
MPLSVADILRWDPEAARDVARAANGRAATASEVATGLQRLPASGTWDGDAADAAQSANTRLQTDLQDHYDEATSVGRAASNAADDMETVQRDLRQLQGDAEDLGMQVAPATGQIVPSPGFRGTPAQLAANVAELEPRLVAIQAEAARVEAEFASGVSAAGNAPAKPSIQAVDFKQGPPIPNPGAPDDPVKSGGGPTGTDIAGVTENLPHGTQPNIKLVQTQQQLEQLYKWASQNGTAVPDPYGPNPGTAYVLPDGTRVGMRAAAGSTGLPALDVNYPGKGWEKIHINPTEGAAPQIPGARLGPLPEAPPVRAPVPAEAPPIEGPPKGGGVPMVGGPGTPVGPTLVPPPHSIHHLPVLGEDDTEAPWEYGE